MKYQIDRLKLGVQAAGLALVGLLLAAGTIRATPPTPLLHYTFDDGSGTVSAADTGVSPAANGQFNGAATRTSNTPNGTGYALDISTSGASDYVHCGDPAKLNGSATLSNGVTMTCWVNLRGNPSQNDRIMSKLSTTGGFDLRINNSSPTAAVLTFAADTTSSGAFSSGINLSMQWVFVAVTYDGTKSSGNVVYYSGGTNTTVTLVNTTSWTQGLIRDSGLEFRVGSTAASTADRTPPAWIDDVRVYDSVLSAVDLESIRLENGFPGPFQFITQPASATVYQTTSNVTLTATANLPVAFEQWYFDGTNQVNAIAGATNSTLVLNNLTTNLSGTYSLYASNSSGAIWSSNATVTVVQFATTGQMTNLWNILPGDTNHPYITTTAGGERGLAYDGTTSNLLVVTHVPTNNLVVLDPATGIQKYLMNVSGIATDASGINMVGVADDGTVYAGNVVVNAGSASTPYQLWQWADDSTNTVANLLFSGDPGYGTQAAGLRWGDNIAVRGEGPATQILITPGSETNGYGTNFVLLTTADGFNFSQEVIGVAGAPSGFGQGGVAFGPGTNTFWAKKRNNQLFLIQFDMNAQTGAVQYAFGSSNTFQFISASRSQKWLAGITSVSSGLPDNVSLYDISNLTNGPVLADQSLNLTANLNGFNNGLGVGSTAFGGNYLFALDSQNGVRAFIINTNTVLLPFRLVSIAAQSAQSVVLTWQSVAGHTYQVQLESSLANNTWTNIGLPITAQGSVASVTNSVSGATQFYRIQGQ